MQTVRVCRGGALSERPSLTERWEIVTPSGNEGARLRLRRGLLWAGGASAREHPEHTTVVFERYFVSSLAEMNVSGFGGSTVMYAQVK